MPDVLSFRLLGKPRVSIGGTAVTGFFSAKTQALPFFYLTATGRPHTREALAGLLWGDMPQAQAGKDLRHAPSNLRVLVGPHLLITREDAAFDRDGPYRLALEAFAASVRDPASKDLETLHRAVELYQGDFLEGFYVGDARPAGLLRGADVAGPAHAGDQASRAGRTRGRD